MPYNNPRQNQLGGQSRKPHSGGQFRGQGGQRREEAPPPKDILSPYNFVGLSESVAIPDWHGQVSQDLPFSAGLSGWLDIEIEATTPIYVRNAGDHKSYKAGAFVTDCESLIGDSRNQISSISSYENDKWKHFREFVSFYKLPDGRYAIPGTSLKGSIRTLVQIMTQSRLAPVGDRKYAVRDLRNRDLYTDWFSETKGGAFRPKVHAGWLERDKQGNSFITPCEFVRVEQQDLERAANNLPRLGGKGEVKHKYRAWHDAHMPTELHFEIGEEKSHPHSRNSLIYAKATPSGSGGKSGIVVFTGQPSSRGRSGTKHMEFVFHSERPEGKIEVSKALFKAFVQTHCDELEEPGEAWAYWKSKLNAEEKIPVFYLAYGAGKSPAANTPTVSLATPGAVLYAFGLAMMFRLPYSHTLRDAVSAPHQAAYDKGAEPDFAECLFGYQREKTDDEGFKGRVSFGPAIAMQAEPSPAVVTVLGAPKPTYYPNYIKQTHLANGGSGRLQTTSRYTTLMDAGVRLRGWKFYPAHKDGFLPAPPLPPEGHSKRYNFKAATAFEPLKAGTKFRSRVRFHNLRPEEFGALVWALTWGGDPECRHRLGMAKPLGYGCAKISLIDERLVANDPETSPRKAQDYMKDFSSWVQGACDGWLDSSEIAQDLLGMARHNHGCDASLRYPKLPMQGPNEFAQVKGSRDGSPSLALRLWRDIEHPSRGGTPSAGRTQQQGDSAPASRPSGSSSVRQSSAHPGTGAKYQVDEDVTCKVVKRTPEKQKATLAIVGGGINDFGGLAPDAKPRFAEIPEIGQTISMKIAVAGTGCYQFKFPDPGAGA